MDRLRIHGTPRHPDTPSGSTGEKFAYVHTGLRPNQSLPAFPGNDHYRIVSAQHGITGNDPALPASLPAKERRRNTQYQQRVATLNSRIKTLQTLPSLLRAKGYRSHQSGKWWEGSYADGGFTDGMTHGDPTKGGRHGDLGLRIGRQGLQPIFDFIEESDDEPFFVWYAPFLPHTPHNPPAELFAKYQKPDRPLELTKYYAMCEWFDQTCGELIDFIDRKGLGRETVIIYVTDNGWIQRTPCNNGSKNWGKAFAPRSKQSPAEGGVRTPIMFRWTGEIQPRMDDSTLVSSVDIAPTILALAGLEPSAAMKGLNILDPSSALKQRQQVFGEVYAHDIANLQRPSESLLYRWWHQQERQGNLLFRRKDRAIRTHPPLHARRSKTPTL